MEDLRSQGESGRFRRLVTRGANICLYVLREASQGSDIFLDVEKFLEDASEESKAFHHRHARVGLQESCPQNNFRRIIAANVPAGEFCNHKVNYCPAHKCSVDLRLLLGFLNSKLLRSFEETKHVGVWASEEIANDKENESSHLGENAHDERVRSPRLIVQYLHAHQHI